MPKTTWPNTIVFTVTAADIKAGICREPSKCPVALAVQRLYPSYDVLVDDTEILIERDQETHIYTPSPATARFINAVDERTYGLRARRLSATKAA